MAIYDADLESNVTPIVDKFTIKEMELPKDFIDYGNVMTSIFKSFDKEALKFYKTINS